MRVVLGQQPSWQLTDLGFVVCQHKKVQIVQSFMLAQWYVLASRSADFGWLAAGARYISCGSVLTCSTVL